MIKAISIRARWFAIGALAVFIYQFAIDLAPTVKQIGRFAQAIEQLSLEE